MNVIKLRKRKMPGKSSVKELSTFEWNIPFLLKRNRLDNNKAPKLLYVISSKAPSPPVTRNLVTTGLAGQSSIGIRRR
ncbi:MAG TPA: hypothetical protein PLD35_03800 [Caldisericia bacterium]|nr:hypothetical protein [Caldisericia bacterium]